jgi:hypothetical protein
MLASGYVRCAVVAVTVAATAVGTTAVAHAAPAQLAAPGSRVSSSMVAPAGLQVRPTRTPLLVPDRAAYRLAKAKADAAAARIARTSTSDAPGPLAPVTVHSWQGIDDSAHAPSDSTSAVGTTRFIELINSDYAIYDKTSTTPLTTGSLTDITGCVTGFGCADSVFDPQVIWDPGTRRFYYVADDVIDATHNYLAFGWSKTASPTGSSWCRYNLAFGSSFADYPKLGDTKDFQLIGTNIFNGNTYSGSDLSWISKPPSGTTCPAPSALQADTVAGLKNADGTAAFTPVPANQTDTSSIGWAVARPAALPAGGATFLTVFKVTRNATTGAAVIPLTGTKVTVPAYKVPAAAPQKGSANTLDTSDTRNTQAVSAIDPAHGTSVGLWTQHTVFGGAGAQVRWYEIAPASHTLFQSGTVTSANLFTFNGAVSPDRVVNGRTKAFGSNMVLDVNTSSATTNSTLKMVSKVGAAAQSAPVLVANSSGPDIGFDCVADGGQCRWGDYAAATPDPSAPTAGTSGLVWGTSMLTYSSSDTSSANWATWNFAATP